MTRLPKKWYSIILFLLVLLTFYNGFLKMKDFTSQVYYYFNPENSMNSIHCFRDSTSRRLPDITSAPIRKGKSIFFHETSCRSYSNGKITILPRQACAVESAAKVNPDLDVYLTFSSPGVFKLEGTTSDRILQKLLEYKNLNIVHLNYANYTRDTPLEELYSSGMVDGSLYAQSHASDVLRYLTLYKYGGVYLDIDVIVIKPLAKLSANYAGIETKTNVAAGVLSFQHEGKGHQFALDCILDLKHNFKPREWGENGPGVITRLLRKLCGVTLGKDMVKSDCKGFTVHNTYAFYPISFGDWEMYFDPNKTDEVLHKARNSYVLHVWNKASEKIKVPIGTKTAYTTFAEKYCPKVYKECDIYF